MRLSSTSYLVAHCLPLAFLLIFAPGARAQSADETAIRAVLARQASDWNRGDIPAFMVGYWPSDSLQFVSASGVTSGWQNTLDRYRQRYPDRATMGTLRFELQRISLLGREHAFVVGKFFLTRPQKGDASGYFTLLWRKINGQWLITTDHS